MEFFYGAGSAVRALQEQRARHRHAGFWANTNAVPGRPATWLSK
jgi:hypothetical protein